MKTIALLLSLFLTACNGTQYIPVSPAPMPSPMAPCPFGLWPIHEGACAESDEDIDWVNAVFGETGVACLSPSCTLFIYGVELFSDHCYEVASGPIAPTRIVLHHSGRTFVLPNAFQQVTSLAEAVVFELAFPPGEIDYAFVHEVDCLSGEAVTP